MATFRSTLLRWLPFLGPLHRTLHAARTRLSHFPAKLRQNLDHVRFDILWESRIRRLSKHPGRVKLHKPIVHLYAVCRNEERLIPYFIDHYSKFVDEFYVYDNLSSDSSVQLLSRYNHVTVIPYDTCGTFDEPSLMRIKNNEWKKSRGKADFVIACDMDELLHHPNMDILLSLLHQHGYTVVKPHGFNMTSTTLPVFNGKQGITEIIRTGFDSRSYYSKSILFSPELNDIHFSTGCHKAAPEGRVKWFRSDHLKLLHYKYIDRDIILQKTRENRDRLSETNRIHGWSRHYLKTDEQALAEFDRIVSTGKIVI